MCENTHVEYGYFVRAQAQKPFSIFGRRAKFMHISSRLRGRQFSLLLTAEICTTAFSVCSTHRKYLDLNVEKISRGAEAG
jgi:hypothetical protein